MNDDELIARITHLIEEEHNLESHGERTDPDRAARLRELEVALDQCWDLLRQRRARRHTGEDPDSAEVRPPGVVEGYQQ